MLYSEWRIPIVESWTVWFPHLVWAKDRNIVQIDYFDDTAAILNYIVPTAIMGWPAGKYIPLWKTELRISDFQHFHWLAGHRLSVHIPAVPNMVKEHVSNKANWKHFCTSEKKRPTKAGFWTGMDRDKDQHGRVVDPGVFNETIILLGLAGYKMITTNSAGYLSLHIQRALVE